MVSVPSQFKAYQGFDALFHSTEGYISASRNEFSKMVAAEAIRNVSRNLAETIRNPENIDAMSSVALGSYLSGIQMAVGSVPVRIPWNMRCQLTMRNCHTAPV